MADTLLRRGGAERFTQAVAALSPAAGPRLAELTPPGQINLRGRPSDPKFVRTVGGVLGCVLPLSANTVTSAADVTVLWLGPDEWLLVTPPGVETALVARLREALGDLHAAVTDVTGNRTRLRLSGPNARETLMKGCALDLHPASFKPGQCAQTLLARSGIILHQIDDTPTYDVYPRRSFSEYTWMWLSDAMAEYQR
ncbi:sarcosine oxidase subunit gamma [Skermanella stibiiresistens SB22]|uniref:Sarcosine oxidase subunit gamma n=1 Tax=Skermanella stibiiresistens SB22 TaxID=1385369 RepID=W9HD79_9PROT|nr:sarcosine oxidase subunit gamma family protein [Skermanella stibiiresistens]EWY42671.1 sarcosine oxidase subunit gamma [Skermanella stibiiresistens SB22]